MWSSSGRTVPSRGPSQRRVWTSSSPATSSSTYRTRAYRDFWDQYIPLTESSLGEALENRGFQIERKEPALLPYTMAGKKPAPLAFVRLYLALPPFWRFLGKQFLVIAAKP
jgi:hypothetical protein